MIDKEKINSYLVEISKLAKQLEKQEFNISKILDLNKIQDYCIEISKELDKDLYD
jgi:hypothetical protein